MHKCRVPGSSGDVKCVEETQVEELKANFCKPLFTREDDDCDKVRKMWYVTHDKKPACYTRFSGVSEEIATADFTRGNRIHISLFEGGVNVTGNAIGGIEGLMW